MRERPPGAPPPWGAGRALPPWSVGIEDEALLLEPSSGMPCNRVEDVLAVIPDRLAGRVAAETHACVIELRTAPHATVAAAGAELAALRADLDVLAGGLGVRVAAAGTHPVAEQRAVRLTRASRYREVARSTRALARRVPTLALHVHVGVPDAEAGVRALDGMRGDLPLLLALAANSPFASGADTGFASFRTPLFSAFPRVGIPRVFGSYATYADVIATLVAGGAVPDPSFVWWDARLQPRLGTVEVRVMDAQSRVEDAAALAALVQCLARRHAVDPPHGDGPPEVLAENRFVAARDGVQAELLHDGRRRPAAAVALGAVEECREVASELGCAAELDDVMALAADPGYARQRRIAERHGIGAIAQSLAAHFAPGRPASAAA